MMVKPKTCCSLWHDLLRDGGLVAVTSYEKYNGGLSPRDVLSLTRITASLASCQPVRPIEARSFLTFEPEDWDNHLVLIGGVLSNQVTRAMTESSLRHLEGTFVLQMEMLSDTLRPRGRNCLSPAYIPGLETNVAGAEVDFGYICIQPNPMNLKKKLYLIAGVKGWGSLAAATAFSAPEHYEVLNDILARHFEMSQAQVDACSLIEIVVRAEVGATGAHGVRQVKHLSIELVRVNGHPKQDWTPASPRLDWGPRPTLIGRPRPLTQHLSLSINSRIAVSELSGTAFGVRFDQSRLTSSVLDKLDDSMRQVWGVGDKWRAGAREIARELVSVLPQGFTELLARMQSVSAPAAGSWIRFVTPRDYLRAPFEFLRTERDFLVLEYPVFRAISSSFCVRSGLSHALIHHLRAVNEPLRILLVASDPSQTILDDVNSEVESIEAALKKAELAGKVDLAVDVVWAEDATIDNVQRHFARPAYHIFHFAGHSRWDAGDPEQSGLLLLAGGRPAILTTDQLASWIKRSELRFCFLSSCEGARSDTEERLLQYDFLGLADALIQMGVPEVLGYRWLVPSQGAKRLADSFYTNLFLGEQFYTEQAALKARCAIAEADRNNLAWISPILVSQK